MHLLRRVSYFRCWLRSRRVLLSLQRHQAKSKNSSGTKKKVERPKQVENKNAPTILQAEQIMGRPARDLYLDYEVEVQRDQTLLTGDHGIFRQEENEARVSRKCFHTTVR